MLQRRMFMKGAAGVALIAAGAARAGKPEKDNLAVAIADIERRSGGRLGVAVHDTGTGRRFAHRGDERFAFCSTFKFLLAGAILHRVDLRRERLERRLPVAASDIVSHSPVTEKLVGKTATVGELCDATMTTSDNGAANILVRALGGPDDLVRFLRAIGDRATRTERLEPALNSAIPGDPRDTTTPGAMAGNLDRLLLGRVLTSASRKQLLGWMIANTTGDTRLRAGVPRGWIVGDKTGAGENGTVNDVAILLPPTRPPILIACYLTETKLPTAEAHRIHADVARAVTNALV